MGEPVLEINYKDAEEVTNNEFERQKALLPEEDVLREAKEFINPSYIE